MTAGETFHHVRRHKGLTSIEVEERRRRFIATAVFPGQVAMVQFGGSIFRMVRLSLKDRLLIVAATSVVLRMGETWRVIARLRVASE